MMRALRTIWEYTLVYGLLALFTLGVTQGGIVVLKHFETPAVAAKCPLQ